MIILKTIKVIMKWLLLPLVIFGLFSAFFYVFIEPKKDRNWAAEHATLPKITISGKEHNPNILIENIRDFQWISSKEKIPSYRNERFQLKEIRKLKAVVSHFSAISEIAHVFIIFALDDGREIGISIEARREQGENFSLQGGIFAQFELIYIFATPKDLLGIRKKNKEVIHSYPIKATEAQAQELFLLISKDANELIDKPALYHLFFKNCTNQLVKRVSILTKRKYPWYFQTLAPGNTGKMLFDLGLIDLPDTEFEVIQAKTLVK